MSLQRSSGSSRSSYTESTSIATKREKESPLDFIAGRLLAKIPQRKLISFRLLAHPTTIAELRRTCGKYVLPIPGTDRYRVNSSVTLYPSEQERPGVITRMCKYIDTTGDF